MQPIFFVAFLLPFTGLLVSSTEPDINLSDGKKPVHIRSSHNVFGDDLKKRPKTGSRFGQINKKSHRITTRAPLKAKKIKGTHREDIRLEQGDDDNVKNALREDSDVDDQVEHSKRIMPARKNDPNTFNWKDAALAILVVSLLLVALLVATCFSRQQDEQQSMQTLKRNISEVYPSDGPTTGQAGLPIRSKRCLRPASVRRSSSRGPSSHRRSVTLKPSAEKSPVSRNNNVAESAK